MKRLLMNLKLSKKLLIAPVVVIAFLVISGVVSYLSLVESEVRPGGDLRNTVQDLPDERPAHQGCHERPCQPLPGDQLGDGEFRRQEDRRAREGAGQDPGGGRGDGGHGPENPGADPGGGQFIQDRHGGAHRLPEGCLRGDRSGGLGCRTWRPCSCKRRRKNSRSSTSTSTTCSNWKQGWGR